MGLTFNNGRNAAAITSNSSLNVGIGTSSPTDSSGFGRIVDLNGSTGAAYYARYNSSATAYFLLGQDSSASYLYAKSTPLTMLVNNAERMRIDTSGNVGIGTSNPISLLNLYGSILLQLQNSSTGSADTDGTRITLSGTDLQIINRESASTILYTNDAERMRITSTGLVGIGTSTPSNTYQGLTIYGTNPSLSLHTSAAGGWTWTEYRNSAGTNNFSMGVNQSIPQFAIKAGAGLDSPNFVMNSSGNVGIGNSTPPNKLFITGTGGISGIVGWSDGVTGTGFLGQTTGGVTYMHSNNNALAFGANGSNNFSETMRLTGGNVGIGTSSPSYKLHVYGGPILADDGTRSVFLNPSADFGNGSAPAVQVSTNHNLQFATNNSLRMTIATDGGVYFSTTAGYVLYTRPSGGTYYRFLYSGASTNIMYSGGSAIGFNNFADSIRIFNVLDNGNYSFSGSNISDVRLKSNITPITMNATEKICKLESVSYVMTDNESQIRYGFIAQEVAKILPDLISGKESEGYIGLDYNGILSLVVKGFQEQQKQIEELKSLINK